MSSHETSRSWEEAKLRFPTGRLVIGTVSQHHPFGIFVDLGDPVAKGLVQITDFVDEGQMTLEQYPPIGSTIRAIALGHTDDSRKQVWLGMKPSQLKGGDGQDRRDPYGTPGLSSNLAF
jgi:ribosomal protein S1